jgi:glycosyltransferase involved in cell wall biosynthesis
MIAFLQPHVPNYRQTFFEGINKQLELDVYCYESHNVTKDNSFESAELPILRIKGIVVKGFLIYNPFFLLHKKYSVLVLMLHIGHLTTWVLLLTKWIHNKEVILFGHGISVKRYINEEKKPSLLLKLMLFLSDGVLLYTQKEADLWLNIYPNKKIIALSNTISGITDIIHFDESTKTILKAKYNITQERIVIFCARFNTVYRRIHTLIETIEKLDDSRFGFIIIGDGKLKPDFSQYSNVYDFGAVYDRHVKNELFGIADIYYQPGWVGLSIVEAMAYGKPIFTFERDQNILQCVEYHYIQSNINGFAFQSFDEFLKTINTISNEEIIVLGNNAQKYVHEVLNMDNMINSAVTLITAVQE